MSQRDMMERHLARNRKTEEVKGRGGEGKGIWEQDWLVGEGRNKTSKRLAGWLVRPLIAARNGRVFCNGLYGGVLCCCMVVVTFIV